MSERSKLRLRVHGVSNGLWNQDLAAIQKNDRTWGIYNYFSFWVAMSVCIPTYMLASGLIAAGMTWKEALGTILLGNVIVLVPIVLNAHAGAKYGIPFPVYLRASFGVLGANIPATLRALVAGGWFGIQCWIGGEALFRGLKIFVPRLDDGAVWFCFAAFWLLNMAVEGRENKTVKRLRRLGTPLMLGLGLALLLWMVRRAGGIGVVLGDPHPCYRMDCHGTPPHFWKTFFSSITGVVGFWAIAALSISDVTRFARSQRTQLVGQAIGLPVAMTLYSLIGIAVTRAAMILNPEHRAIWNPIELIASFHQPMVAAAGLMAILLAALNTNIASNLVGPARAFSSLSPDLISFRMGGLIARLLGLASMPWRLVADPERYINGWLVGSSGLLGPIAGIMLVDYFVVRGRSLDLNELYVRGGAYEYWKGFNRRALVALASGMALVLVGLFVPRLHWLYQYAWFVGFAVAALVYLMLMSGPDVRAMIPPTPLLLPVDGFEAESPMA